MQGDRVTAEYYLQFADHYFRVLSENRQRFEEQRPRREWQQNEGYEAAEGNDEAYDGEEGERDNQLDQRGDEQRYAGQPNGEQRFEERDNRGNGGRDQGHRDNGGERAARRPDRAEREDRYERDDRQGRQGREEVSERIEVDRLPPSIPFDPTPLADEPTDNGEAVMAEAPRRRGRPRRPRPDDQPIADA